MKTMKQIWRITALLGVAFAFAGVSQAFAVWGNSTYSNWRDVSSAMPVGETPHGNYTTTSQKCKVCHAVHNAAPAGERLLRSTTSNACSYCHITNNVSDYVVYGGKQTNYSGSDFQNAHNTGVAGTLNNGCSDCHTVHAAYDLLTANTGLAGDDLGDKLLTGDKVFDEFNFNYDELAREPLSTDTYDTALTKWCTKCHMSGGSGAYVYYANSYYLGINTHVMKSVSTTYTLASGETTQVAWSSSAQCSSCHVSQYRDGSHAWPHYTSGARFLVSADPYSAVTTAAVTAGNTKIDGVCLRCHRTATRGVGVTW